jgi:hypothetical protein
MPNRPQAQNPPDLEKPVDFEDEPPPIIKATGDNEAGEGEAELSVPQADEKEEGENEGEGSRTADRNYRKGLKKHLETKNVEQEAEEAAEALDDDEQRADLEEAEEAARKGQIH